ncbi:hypothetical protein, partial [Citrobacter portucalensis]|uniref:hypothetical protein n=1 Tax=Citrobacter portucalensis TaxID=1639133 RepID=UPI00292BFFE5
MPIPLKGKTDLLSTVYSLPPTLNLTFEMETLYGLSFWANSENVLPSFFCDHFREGANKRGNSSRLTQSFHFFMFEPIF